MNDIQKLRLNKNNYHINHDTNYFNYKRNLLKNYDRKQVIFNESIKNFLLSLVSISDELEYYSFYFDEIEDDTMVSVQEQQLDKRIQSNWIDYESLDAGWLFLKYDQKDPSYIRKVKKNIIKYAFRNKTDDFNCETIITKYNFKETIVYEFILFDPEEYKDDRFLLIINHT